MKAKELAQWVIDNRYAKSEFEKISDQEMYLKIVEVINTNYNYNHTIECEKCKYNDSWYNEPPCSNCNDFSNFVKA